jgi:hypothetical protein
MKRRGVTIAQTCLRPEGGRTEELTGGFNRLLVDQQKFRARNVQGLDDALEIHVTGRLLRDGIVARFDLRGASAWFFHQYCQSRIPRNQVL